MPNLWVCSTLSLLKSKPQLKLLMPERAHQNLQLPVQNHLPLAPDISYQNCILQTIQFCHNYAFLYPTWSLLLSALSVFTAFSTKRMIAANFCGDSSNPNAS